jgi:hypothetical protein
MFRRRKTPSTSWSQYQPVKILGKLNSCRRTTTMIMMMKKKTTPSGDVKNEEMYRDTDEIKILEMKPQSPLVDWWIS